LREVIAPVTVPDVRGVIKSVPEDFVVEEIAAYEPSGDGEHVFVRFKKRDMNTDAAARAIARALGADPRAVGIAGNKDKRAVTTQTISLAPPRGVGPDDLANRALALALDGIEVLAAKRHRNKLKTGHLHGNRFAIRVRGLDLQAANAFVERAARVGKEGVPNAFGEQRFGVEKDNATRARNILGGSEPPPRDGRLLRLLYSSLQSDVFNFILEERVRRGTWATALRGDVLKKTDTGGLFVCTDEQQDGARAEGHEVSATGPIWGPKMLRAEGEVGAMELEMAHARLGAAFDQAESGVLGDGTRRALRLFVADCRARVEDPSYNSVASNREQEASCMVEFVLPKGAFATTVLAHLLELGS
jgi:tRNA pseudouridine13 synthase